MKTMIALSSDASKLEDAVGSKVISTANVTGGKEYVFAIDATGAQAVLNWATDATKKLNSAFGTRVASTYITHHGKTTVFVAVLRTNLTAV